MDIEGLWKGWELRVLNLVARLTFLKNNVGSQDCFLISLFFLRISGAVPFIQISLFPLMASCPIILCPVNKFKQNKFSLHIYFSSKHRVPLKFSKDICIKKQREIES